MIKPAPETTHVDDLEAAELALKGFFVALVGHANDGLLNLNLTVPQMRVLRRVQRLRRASGRDLADEFRVTPAAVVPVCDRLEAQGYLQRVRDRDDRRICWFVLTERAAETLDLVASRIRSRIRPAVTQLDRADRESLVKVLGVLTAALHGEHTNSGAAARL